MKNGLVLVIGIVALINPARAAPPRPSVSEVIPAGAAPRNTKVWLFGGRGFSQLSLIDSQGRDVPVSRTNIEVPGSEGIVKLSPGPLEPGTYQVQADGFQVLATISVTDEIDSTPPLAPVADVRVTGRVGAMSSSVTVTSADPNSFLVILEPTQKWETFSVPAASARGSATVSGLPAGEVQLKAVRVDAAGNVSDPTAIVATIPADRSCSVAPVVPLALAALCLLRRRSSARD